MGRGDALSGFAAQGDEANPASAQRNRPIGRGVASKSPPSLAVHRRGQSKLDVEHSPRLRVTPLPTHEVALLSLTIAAVRRPRGISRVSSNTGTESMPRRLMSRTWPARFLLGNTSTVMLCGLPKTRTSCVS